MKTLVMGWFSFELYGATVFEPQVFTVVPGVDHRVGVDDLPVELERRVLEDAALVLDVRGGRASGPKSIILSTERTPEPESIPQRRAARFQTIVVNLVDHFGNCRSLQLRRDDQGTGVEPVGDRRRQQI